MPAAPAISAALLLIVFAPAAARCDDDPGFTNVQFLAGDGFDDTYYGLHTRGGSMRTLTFEHYSVWSHGDNYFYADLYEGEFVDAAGAPTGVRSRLFLEWYPTLSLTKLAGRDAGFGPVTNIYLIGEIGRGEGYRSREIGVGVYLDVPGVEFFGLALLARDDNLNRPTWHASLFLSAPFTWGRVPLEIDVLGDGIGTDRFGADLSLQLQVLLDVGALAGRRARTLQAGMEWYYHANDALVVTAPSALLKWTW